MSLAAYEDLTGADGASMRYRAPRIRARDLFQGAPVDVTIDGAPARLRDLSMSGVAVAGDWPGEIGRAVDISLSVGPEPLVALKGEVARAAGSYGSRIIGVQLTSGPLRLDELSSRRRAIALRSALRRGAGAAAGPVPEDYRRLSGDVLHMLRRARALLSGFGLADPAAAEEALAICAEATLPEWRAFWREANAIIAKIGGDPEVMRATKSYTERLVTPDLIGAPVFRRSYEKPRGYPGDYEVMRMVYEGGPMGGAPYDELAHILSLDIGHCIVQRMKRMGAILADEAGRVAERGRPLRATNVGCGPAREVVSMLKNASAGDRLDLTLIDQDEEALATAYHDCYGETARLGGAARVTCLHASFVQLIKPGELFDSTPPQDLIYSLGVLDYLKPTVARGLVRGLYQQLAPGGRLVLANVGDSPERIEWPLEYIVDWSLLYRSRDDMAALARDLGAQVEVSDEDEGRVLFLSLRKPLAH